jgi:hypothetical protein
MFAFLDGLATQRGRSPTTAVIQMPLRRASQYRLTARSSDFSKVPVFAFSRVRNGFRFRHPERRRALQSHSGKVS